MAADWLTATIHSRWMFLLLLNLFLIVVGALMDIFSAIVIVVPLVVPIGVAFGIDPVHLGIIFLANAELGFLMPPIGENLFLSAYRFNKPVLEVFRSVVPLVLVFLAAVLLITYLPALTTALPAIAGR
jgi:TRAP-type C4-dicarboxylate transport system permease large subunit